MNIFVELTTTAAGEGLEFLLIGGHAVIAFGANRTTEDVDLLVSEKQLPRWKLYLAKLGYRPFFETREFLQLVAPIGAQPLDVMIVDANTWGKVYGAREQRRIAGLEISLPTPLHLIALKFHASRQNPARRTQDWADIDVMVRTCKIDVRSPEFREIFNRYAVPGLYERFLQNHPAA